MEIHGAGLKAIEEDITRCGQSAPFQSLYVGGSNKYGVPSAPAATNFRHPGIRFLARARVQFCADKLFVTLNTYRKL